MKRLDFSDIKSRDVREKCLLYFHSIAGFLNHVQDFIVFESAGMDMEAIGSYVLDTYEVSLGIGSIDGRLDVEGCALG